MIINDCAIESELNVVSFDVTVEDHMRNNNFDSYLSTIVDLCNELDIEFKDVGKMISSALKDKIALEAQESGWMFTTTNPMVRFE